MAFTDEKLRVWLSYTVVQAAHCTRAPNQEKPVGTELQPARGKSNFF